MSENGRLRQGVGTRGSGAHRPRVLELPTLRLIRTFQSRSELRPMGGCPLYLIGALRTFAPILYATVSQGSGHGDMAIREASPLGHDATLPAGGDRCAPWACRETGPPELPKPRLLDPRPPGLGSRHYIRRTEKAYVHWIKRYVFLLGKRYPAEVGATEVTAFLTSLAVQGQGGSLHPEPDPERLALSLSRRAGRQLPWLNDVVRAKQLVHLAVVLTHEEVRAVLQRLDGVPRLVAILLYGVALRLLEYCRLRVKDVDFATNQITIRHGKGHEDRVTMLSAAVKADLSSHLERVRRQHEGDLRHGADWVELPSALLRKYPYAGRTWEWQWVFPAIRFSVFPRRTIAAHAGCAGPIRACMFPMRSS